MGANFDGKFHPAAFKAYDIRGTVPQQLNPEFAFSLGRALAQRARGAGVAQMIIGHDGRHSSPQLAASLSAGIRAGGVATTALGLVPTPLVYFAAHASGCGSGVAITGSHNPPEYNGFKMMLAGTTLSGAQIRSLLPEMEALSPIPADPAPDAPPETQLDIIPEYIGNISKHIRLARPMKIAIDCGNGVGGVLAGRLLRALGCEVDELFAEVNGDFPNHHPDPADPENLQDLIRHVQNTDCELGLALDGDGDRLGVVSRAGEIIWPDRQMILFARDVLRRAPGAQIIFDVKCSRHLGAAIRAAGGTPLMTATGHSLIKAKLLETGAPLAGEMSGHIFFKERWFGFDDGLYAAARLLEILARSAEPSAVLHALPQAMSTPELKLPMAEGEPHEFIRRLQQYQGFPTAQERICIDGLRLEYARGFGLARASNTTPVVVLRFEGDDSAALAQIQAEFRAALQALLPGRELPF